MPFSAVQTAFDAFFPMGKLQSYWKAQNLRHLANQAYDEALSRYDLLAMPTTPFVATPLAPRNAPVEETVLSEEVQQEIDRKWRQAMKNGQLSGTRAGAVVAAEGAVSAVVTAIDSAASPVLWDEAIALTGWYWVHVAVVVVLAATLFVAWRTTARHHEEHPVGARPG
jgi:hypothetical protein